MTDVRVFYDVSAIKCKLAIQRRIVYSIASLTNYFQISPLFPTSKLQTKFETAEKW